MNIGKIQLELLKALLKNPGAVNYCQTDDDCVLVTVKPYLGYKIPRSWLRVMLTDAQLSLTLEELCPEAEALTGYLKPTDEYRMGGTAQKFLYDGDENRPVYIDSTLLANFDAPVLYQVPRYSSVGPVVITERGIDSDQPTVVGFVAPVKIKD